MKQRHISVQDLSVGDIFHGTTANGVSLLCLVTALTDSRIFARRFPTQEDLEFDRRTGVEVDGTGKIDCVAPFPADIHEVFLAMDCKYRAQAEMHRRGIAPSPASGRLTPEEKRALLSIQGHVAANRLELP